MARSEVTRHRVFEAFKESFGEEVAGDVLEMLPPAGIPDLATKDDIALVRSEMVALEMRLRLEIVELGAGLRGEMAELRGEFEDLRGSLQGEMGDLRGEIGELRGEIGVVRGEIGALRHEMRTEMAMQFTRAARLYLGALGVAVALLAVLVTVG